MKEQRKIELQHQNEIDIQTFENELHDIEHQIRQLQSRKKEIEENLPQAKQAQKKFEKIDDTKNYCMKCVVMFLLFVKTSTK